MKAKGIILNTIVCYNNAEEIISYCRSISNMKNKEQVFLSIVINRLDNFSHFEFEKKIKDIEVCSLVTWVDTNLGYLGGMLVAYKNFINRYKNSISYVVMSNTDIEFPSLSFFDVLLKKNYSKDILAIGPAIITGGRYCNPILYSRRRKTDIERVIRILQIPLLNVFYIYLSALKSKFFMGSRGNSSDVYEIHGCFFIVRTELVEAMLQTPFRAFMYSEEAYVAEMVYQRHKKIFYDSELLVKHNAHAVTSKLDYKKTAKYISESMKVVLKDFYI